MVAEEIEQQQEINIDNRKCCSCLQFSDIKEAKGFALLNVTRGTIVMTNVFLSTSLLNLAKNAAGCDVDDDNCSNKVYGFRPSSFITIIAVLSGILAALLMPFTVSLLIIKSFIMNEYYQMHY